MRGSFSYHFAIPGRKNKNIAAESGIGEQTVKVHRRRVMRKAGLESC